MKSFTAKEFSRCPAKVYEAARENGKAEITHDRFGGKFQIYYMAHNAPQLKTNDVIRIEDQQFRVTEKSTDIFLEGYNKGANNLRPHPIKIENWKTLYQFRKGDIVLLNGKTWVHDGRKFIEHQNSEEKAPD